MEFNEKNEVLFSIKIFDLQGNWIAEVEKNYWRPNKNFTGKFNYDENGFEVLDNKNQVVFNVDILENNKIFIQGVIPVPETKNIYLWGDNSGTGFPFLSQEEIQLYNARKKSDYYLDLKKQIEYVKIKQLFEYTTKDFLHKRKK